MKYIGIAYSVAALAVAGVTTALQTYPALWMIDLLTGSDNKFPIVLSFLLTSILLLIPLVAIILVMRLFSGKANNQVPENLQGKTGIMVYRAKALQDGLYANAVMINGNKMGGVTNGKRTFIELVPGDYKVFIKSGGKTSPVVDIELKHNAVVYLKTGYREDGLKAHLLLERDDDQS